MPKVLALLDGSIYAQSVCDYAAWAAIREAASVELLHVLGRRESSGVQGDLSGNLALDERDELLAELAALDAQKAKLSLRRGRLILDEAKARLLAAGVSEVTTKLRHGDLLETLAEFETDAALVIVGKRGEAADFAKGHLGSNLERIVRASRKPVLVAARAFKPVSRFLIAYDGGPSAEKALQHIVRDPLLQGAHCEILTIGAETEMRSRLDAAGARLEAAGYPVTKYLIAGIAEDVIAARVEKGGIDLIVMGAYGHGRIRNLVVGSTTTAMVQRCKAPVLMFR
jgi:nucleotide-binding universal stress UspA family protein